MIWLLVDMSFLAHRARHVMEGLEHEDQPTGVIFGFFETLRTICFDRRILTNRVALFFDSRHSIRKEMFPAYKQKRHENRTEEELAAIAIAHQQIDRLHKDILPEIGFKTYTQEGLESDDLMAKAAAQLESAGTGLQAVIVTSDGDLYQCIRHGIHWFDPVRDLYLDPGAFWAKKAVDPQDWASVKSIGGCRGDEVPGVPGVGEMTAIQYVTHTLKPGSKRFLAIESEQGQKIIKRNRKLVTLPHRVTDDIDLVDPVYDNAAFQRWCEELGLRSYQNKYAASWSSFFAGAMTAGVQQPRKRHEKRSE